MQTQQKIQIIILGNAAVGKTSLLKMYHTGTIPESHITTIGLDFVPTTFNAPDGTKVPVKIWDTAGQERFRTLTHGFYKQANGVIIAYDVTNEESFNSVKIWLQSLEKHANENIFKVLVGNKIDLVDQRKIDEETGRKKAEEFNMAYYETSAKLGRNINSCMEFLMSEVWKNLQDSSSDMRQTITVNKNNQKAGDDNRQQCKC